MEKLFCRCNDKKKFHHCLPSIRRFPLSASAIASIFSYALKQYSFALNHRLRSIATYKEIVFVAFYFIFQHIEMLADCLTCNIKLIKGYYTESSREKERE